LENTKYWCIFGIYRTMRKLWVYIIINKTPVCEKIHTQNKMVKVINKNVIDNKGGLSILSKFGFEKRIIQSGFEGGYDTEYYVHSNQLLCWLDINSNVIWLDTNPNFDTFGNWKIVDTIDKGWSCNKEVIEYPYDQTKMDKKFLNKIQKLTK